MAPGNTKPTSLVQQIDERGTLVIIGGAEDKTGDCVILSEFVRLAHGEKANIVVMTVATDRPNDIGREYLGIFKRLGAHEATLVDVSERTDAYDERSLNILKEATGIFFTGGDQLHITSLLGGTPMHQLLLAHHKKRHVIAGTSAGASMMSNSMFIKGRSDNNPRFGGMEIGPGMNFISGCVIDTHFSQRGRIGRLMTSVAHYPQDIGFGIDENTGMIVHNNEFEVIGEGSVTVVDVSQMSFTSLPLAEENDSLALFGVKLHVLPAGYRFDLETRRPIVDPRVQREIDAQKPRSTARRARG